MKFNAGDVVRLKSEQHKAMTVHGYRREATEDGFFPKTELRCICVYLNSVTNRYDSYVFKDELLVKVEDAQQS